MKPSAIEWPSSSKLAQLLCHVEKKFAKHIGPEEFVQCSQNLIKEEQQQQQQQSDYDVPASSILFPSPAATSIIANSISTAQQQQQQSHDALQSKKKTCNLENYFEWSTRLRLLVANEILLVGFYLIIHTFPHNTNTFTQTLTFPCSQPCINLIIFLLLHFQLLLLLNADNIHNSAQMNVIEARK